MPSSKFIVTFKAATPIPAAASERYFILFAVALTLEPKPWRAVDIFPIRLWLASHSSCSFFSALSFAFVRTSSRSNFRYAAEVRSTPLACACFSAVFNCRCFSSASLTDLARSCVFCAARAGLFGLIFSRVFIPRSSDCATFASAFNFLNAASSCVVLALKSISMPLIIVMFISSSRTRQSRPASLAACNRSRPLLFLRTCPGPFLLLEGPGPQLKAPTLRSANGRGPCSAFFRFCVFWVIVCLLRSLDRGAVAVPHLYCCGGYFDRCGRWERFQPFLDGFSRAPGSDPREVLVRLEIRRLIQFE